MFNASAREPGGSRRFAWSNRRWQELNGDPVPMLERECRAKKLQREKREKADQALRERLQKTPPPQFEQWCRHEGHGVDALGRWLLAALAWAKPRDIPVCFRV